MASADELPFDYVYAPQVIALASTLTAVNIIIVAIRFYIRRLQKARLGIDDWLSLGALVMLIGMAACLLAGAKLHLYGYPTPRESCDDCLPPAEIQLAKIEWSFQILMFLAYLLIKLSILFFYRRLFITSRRSFFDVLSLFIIVIVLLWTLIFLLLFIFNCGTSISAHWNYSPTTCRFSYPLEESMAASDLGLDILMFLLPFPMIWRVSFSTTRKIAISCIFLVGAMAIGASIARLILYLDIVKYPYDRDLGVTTALYWSLLETGLALLAACLPSLSYLLGQSHNITSLMANAYHTISSVVSLRSRSSSLDSQSSTVLTGDGRPAGKFEKGRFYEVGRGTNSELQIVPKGHNAEMETFARGDASIGSEESGVDGMGIRVKRAISQRSDHDIV